MDKLPCIDCLTLSICKATVKNYSGHIEPLTIIINKCSLIKQHLRTLCVVGQPYEYTDQAEYLEHKKQAAEVASEFLDYIGVNPMEEPKE